MGNTYGYRSLPVYNDTDEWVPSYGIMRLVSMKDEDGQSIRVIGKPDRILAITQDTSLCIINGPTRIPPNSYGQGSQDWPLQVLHTTGDSIQTGDNVGPVANEWAVSIGGSAFNWQATDPTGAYQGSDTHDLGFVSLAHVSPIQRFQIVGYRTLPSSSGGAPGMLWAYGVPVNTIDKTVTYHGTVATTLYPILTEIVTVDTSPPVYPSAFVVDDSVLLDWRKIFNETDLIDRGTPSAFGFTPESVMAVKYPGLVKIIPPYPLQTIEDQTTFISQCRPGQVITASVVDPSFFKVTETASGSTIDFQVGVYTLTQGAPLRNDWFISNTVTGGSTLATYVEPYAALTHEGLPFGSNTYSHVHVKDGTTSRGVSIDENTEYFSTGQPFEYNGAVVACEPKRAQFVQYAPNVVPDMNHTWGPIGDGSDVRLWPGLPGLTLHDIGEDELDAIAYTTPDGTSKTLYLAGMEQQEETTQMAGVTVGSTAQYALAVVNPAVYDSGDATVYHYNGSDVTSTGVTLPLRNLSVFNKRKGVITGGSDVVYHFRRYTDENGALQEGFIIDDE